MTTWWEKVHQSSGELGKICGSMCSDTDSDTYDMIDVSNGVHVLNGSGDSAIPEGKQGVLCHNCH